MTTFAASLPASDQEALDSAATPSPQPASTATSSPVTTTSFSSAQPLPAFPAAGGQGGGRLVFHTGDMNTVTKQVAQDQGTLSKGLTAVNTLGARASAAGPDGPAGHWAPMANIKNNALRAHVGLAAFTERLSTAYEAYHSSLVQAGKIYVDADDTTAQKAKGIIADATGLAKHVKTDIQK